MDDKRPSDGADGTDLPPAPGADSWSPGEAAEWDPDDGTAKADDGDG